MDYHYIEKEVQLESLPQVFYPWRRYFARLIDILIYDSLWTFFCIFVGGFLIKNRTMIGFIIARVVVVLLILLIEPILLSTTGTTLGKAVLGLRIHNRDGRRLSYEQALERTKGVCLKGLGLYIPVLDVILLWKSYHICNENQTLSWDENSSYTMKDKKPYRVWLVIATLITIFMIEFIAILSQKFPPNRGELTKVEFAENLNYYAKYFNIQLGQYIFKEDGKWYKIPSEYIGQVDNTTAMSQFIYTMEGDHISAISFSIDIHDSKDYMSSYSDYLMLAGLAFAGAQPNIGVFYDFAESIGQMIEENRFKSYQFSEAGIRFSCDTTYTGYYQVYNLLVPLEEHDEYDYSLRFQMEKIN